MLPYSYIHHRDSVIHKNQITFISRRLAYEKTRLVSLVITFNDDAGLSRYLGESVEFLSHNLAIFSQSKGTSS